MSRERLYYSKGLEAFKNNNINTAIKNFEIGLQNEEQSVDTLNLLGLCKYIMCNFKEANFYWSKSLKIQEKENKAVEYILLLSESLIGEYNKGILKVQGENYLKAIEIFEDIVKEYNELIEPYYILGTLYLNKKNLKRAKLYFLKGISLNKEDTKTLEMINYISNIKKENLKKAIIGIGVLSVLVVGYLGTDLFNYKEELKILENNYVIEITKYKEENKKLLDSKKETDIEVKENELLYKDEKTVFNEGISYYNDKNYKEALEKFMQIKEYGIEKVFKAEATFYVASSLENLKEYTLAIEIYNEYIERYKNENYYDDSTYNCGLLLYKIGEKVKAKRVLKSLEENPTSMFYNTKVKGILGEK